MRSRALPLAVALAAFAVAGLVAMTIVFANDEAQRRQNQGRSALTNCQQVELVKSEIRKTLRASLAQLPRISYYKTHPEELEFAIKNGEETLARFAARDCYQLPVVKDSGLTPRKRN